MSCLEGGRHRHGEVCDKTGADDMKGRMELSGYKNTFSSAVCQEVTK
jgi:hypothetical protein